VGLIPDSFEFISEFNGERINTRSLATANRRASAFVVDPAKNSVHI